MTVLGQLKRLFDVLFDDVEGNRHGSKERPSILKFGGDSVLILPEEVDRQGFRVVQLKELLALVG